MAIGRKKKKKAKTKEEELHLDRVGSLPCCVCGYYEVQVHHLTGAGMGLRSSHFDTIPLCHYHHVGDEGIHIIGKKTWQNKYGYEKEHLEKTRELLNE